MVRENSRVSRQGEHANARPAAGATADGSGTKRAVARRVGALPWARTMALTASRSQPVPEDVMTILKTIVVAVDFSDIVDDVIRTACAVADPRESSIHVITVVPDPVRQAWSTEVPGLDFEAIHERWVQEAETRLAALVPKITLHPAQVTRAVLTGVPDREIVRYAREHEADLLVVGTHGYGPFKRLILGSVVDRVLRQAPCAILAVPPSAHAAHEHEATATQATGADGR